jgi:hypothetical protein
MRFLKTLTENVYIKKALEDYFSLGILIAEIRSQWSQRKRIKEDTKDVQQ